jgi:perosamine synthetase
MPNYVIIGLGSQADVIEAILNQHGISPFRIAYGDVPGDSQDIPSHLEDHCYILAIGDNKTRHEIAREYERKYPNIKWFNAISPRADIATTVKIGVGNVICAGAVVATHTNIGDHCIINTNASVDHHCKIGSFVHVAPNSAVCGNVTLHDGVFIGVGSSVVEKRAIRPWAFHRANTLVSKSSAPIPIYQPYLPSTHRSVVDALETGWISSQGEYIKKCQQIIQERLGIKHALLLANGTCATHCLFMALKHRYPQITKIYVPDSCYIAAINSALFEYSLDQLEVMRMDAATWNVDTSEEYWNTLDSNAAVLIVHNVGKIVPVKRLKGYRPDLVFVEDNCEGLFGRYNGKAAGTESLCSSASFFANKSITAGEGGLFMTDDDDLHQFIAKTCNQGVSQTRYLHDCLGYNYRITNLQAAVLYDQLGDLDKILKKKADIFTCYRNNLPKEYQQLEDQMTEGATWMFAIQIPGLINFETTEAFMRERGVDIRPFFFPVNAHGHTKEIKRLYTGVAEDLRREVIMLPSYPELTANEQAHIIECVKDLIVSCVE